MRALIHPSGKRANHEITDRNMKPGQGSQHFDFLANTQFFPGLPDSSFFQRCITRFPCSTGKAYLGTVRAIVGISLYKYHSCVFFVGIQQDHHCCRYWLPLGRYLTPELGGHSLMS